MAWVAVFAGVMSDTICSGTFSKCCKKEEQKPQNQTGNSRVSPQLPSVALKSTNVL